MSGRRGLTRTRTTLALAAAIAASILSACGSSANSGSAAGKSSPLIIGVIGSYTGANASSTAGKVPTYTAWEKWTNAHGGIDGRPVSVIIDDDAGSVATSVSDLRQLIGPQHAAVIVTDTTNADSWTSYIASVKVPVIDAGGRSLNRYWFGPQAPIDPYANIAAFSEGKAAGGSKLAFIYCANISACTDAVASAKISAAQAGLKMVYAGGAAADAPSYAPICLAAKSAGADVLNVYGPVSLQVGVANACAQQGDHFIVVSSNANFTNYWLKYPALDGAVESAPIFPVSYDGNAAAAAYHQAMAKYASSELNNIDYGEPNAAAWVTMQEIAQAVKNSGVSNSSSVTSADILKGLYAMNGNTLGGLTVPLTYTGGANEISRMHCWFTIKISNEKFVTPDGLKTSCYNGAT